jgi:prepilin-type processing-associated H-X9-DG protein
MRREITLIEVLVALAIVAVLFGILLCGVQRLRSAAARVSCAQTLTWMGQALHHYHDTHKKFPPGYISENDAAGNETGPGWGWATDILLDLNCGYAHERISFGLPIEHEKNVGVFRSQYVKSYRCPSDPRLPLFVSIGPRNANGQLSSTICEVSPASYVGNYGDSEPGPCVGTGVFFRNSAVKLGDITDGASSTLMVGERSFKYGDATWVGAVPGSNLSAAPGSDLPRTPKHASSYVLGHTGGATEGLRRPLEVGHFSSAHYRGANFLFADGSVRFLSSSIDYTTLKALSTRAGGEKDFGDF